MARQKKTSASGIGSRERVGKDPSPNPLGRENANGVTQGAKCLTIASQGIQTGGDFAAMMSSLMTDLIEGSVTPSTANSVCLAGGKLLKITELQLRYGKDEPTRSRTLRLTDV